MSRKIMMLLIFSLCLGYVSAIGFKLEGDLSGDFENKKEEVEEFVDEKREKF